MKKGMLFVCMLCMMLLSACSNDKGNVVLAKINGEELHLSTYMVYLYTTTKSFEGTAGEDVWSLDFDGMSAEELVQERAFHTIQSVIAAKDYAQQNGLTLTSEQQQEAKQSAETFLSQVSEQDFEKMHITQSQLETLMEDSYLYDLVYRTIADECDVSTEEVEAYRQEHETELEQAYTQVTVDALYAKDMQTAEYALSEARAGKSLEDIQNSYVQSDIHQEEALVYGNFTTYAEYLYKDFGLQSTWNEGQLTDIIEQNGEYVILQLKQIQKPTIEEIQNYAQTEYETMVQSAYVEETLSGMIDTQEIEKMPEVWATLESFASTQTQS